MDGHLLTLNEQLCLSVLQLQQSIDKLDGRLSSLEQRMSTTDDRQRPLVGCSTIQYLISLTNRFFADKLLKKCVIAIPRVVQNDHSLPSVVAHSDVFHIQLFETNQEEIILVVWNLVKGGAIRTNFKNFILNNRELN